MAAVPNKFFLALAGLNALLVVGHTSKGREQFKHLSLQKLPATLRNAVQTGWYEGSMFFAIMGVLNYKWAQAGVLDIYDTSVLGLYSTLLVGASASYISGGDTTTAIALTTTAVLEGLAAYHAA